MLPKIHKKLVAGLVPGRPIVSCIGYCTSPASRFIDYHLKAIISTRATTVLADTNSLTSKLASFQFPTNSKVVTADVVSLYTNNMCWVDTIAAVLPTVHIGYGLRSVSFLAAGRWNTLPPNCRQAQSAGTFAHLTKIHLGFPVTRPCLLGLP